MAKNKKPVEKEEEVKIETTEMVDEAETVDITPEQFQELVSGGNSVSTFSYGLAESMFMEGYPLRRNRTSIQALQSIS